MLHRRTLSHQHRPRRNRTLWHRSCAASALLWWLFLFAIESATAQSLPPATSAFAQRQITTRQAYALIASLTRRLEAVHAEQANGSKRLDAEIVAWRQSQDDEGFRRLFDPAQPARSSYENTLKQHVKQLDQGHLPQPAAERLAFVDCAMKRLERHYARLENVLVDAISATETELATGSLPTASEATERARDATGFTPSLARCGPSGSDTTKALNSLAVNTTWAPGCLQSDRPGRDGMVPPYQPTTAALLYDNGRSQEATFCTGTLIAPNVVLTAAHCACDTGVKDPRGEFYRTASACLRGTYQRRGRQMSALDPAHQRVHFQHAGSFKISKVLVHPRFRWTDSLPMAELAIYVLEHPVPNIEPAVLHRTRRLPIGSPAHIVGFGAHNPLDTSGRVTTTQSVIETSGLKLQSQTITSRCNFYESARQLICWSYRTGDVAMKLGSTCRGDSGGPLFAEVGGRQQLVGVTSAGGPSCRPSEASRTYDTEIFAFLPWIERSLRENPPAMVRANQRSEPVVVPASKQPLRQIGCMLCEHCHDAEVTIPAHARRLVASLNCTRDQIQPDIPISLSVKVPGSAGSRCEQSVNSTVVTCVADATPNETLVISARTGSLQQCQLLATVLD